MAMAMVRSMPTVYRLLTNRFASASPLARRLLYTGMNTAAMAAATIARTWLGRLRATLYASVTQSMPKV